jgi:hypothetical protein
MTILRIIQEGSRRCAASRERNMNMAAEYLEHALQFERMAGEATDPELARAFSEQAKAYRKLADERVRRLNSACVASMRTNDPVD